MFIESKLNITYWNAILRTFYRGFTSIFIGLALLSLQAIRVALGFLIRIGNLALMGFVPFLSHIPLFTRILP